MMASIKIAFVLTALLASVARAGEDRFMGTWVLDAHESRYGEDPPPSAAIMTLEPAPEGVHYRSQTTFASGVTLTAEYTADLEGHLTLVLGSRGFLAPVSLRRIDERTLQADYQRGLHIVARSRSVVSADGGTLTVTTTSPGDNGTPVVHVGIYHKSQEGPGVLGASADRSASPSP